MSPPLPAAAAAGVIAAPAGALTTTRQLLEASGLAPREARALLAEVLGVSRETLVAHPASPVVAAAAARFTQLAQRRAAGEPLAYVLGWQEFYGQRVALSPAVLIPRPETELLVDTALEHLAQRSGARVLDLGTGSGCIAIALALARPDLAITASDRSAAALAVASANAQRLGAPITMVRSDWYAALTDRYDLIVSNPPYIAAGDPHLADLGWEPRSALLAAGPQGLASLAAVIQGAAPHLAADGRLLVEHGYDQGAAVQALMRAALGAGRTLPDLAGRDRACLGWRHDPS